MRGQNYRGSKPHENTPGAVSGDPAPQRRPNGRHNGHYKDALASPTPDTAASNKLVELLARACGKPVVATVALGAKYLGVLLAVDVSPSGNAAMSAVLVHPALVGKPLLNEKSNSDDAMPEKLVIQAKDLIDIEVSLPRAPADKPEDNGAEKLAQKAKPADLPAEVPAPVPAPAPVAPAAPAAPVQPVPAPELKFKTDRDISAGSKFREREFQKWVPDESTPALTLDEKSNGVWDQFKVNEEKFGVESTYDEHLYTTRINKDAKDYHERLQRAERLAREIEGLSTSDKHILEERGVVVDDSGMDEEDKYSGVLNDSATDTRGNELMAALRSASISNNPLPSESVAPGKYSTPKQRAAQYHNDPAIVSSSATQKVLEKPAPAEPEAEQPKQAAKPTSIPPKPQVPSGNPESFRLNAQSEINALREFSANFKIPHKMPNDLLPILAKDKVKQDEILRKQEPEKSSSASLTSVTATSSPPEQKKELKPFKLNPKAAAFTPSSKQTQLPPNPPMPSYNKSSNNPSPRMHNQRPYSNTSSGGNVRKYHQITAAEFFGGADKVPTAEKQKEKAAKMKKSFNLFATAVAMHTDKSKPVVFQKTFQTPPTWDSTVEDNYEKVIADQTSTGGKVPPGAPSPGHPYMASPIMGVPGAGPHMGAAGGYPGNVGGNKFPVSPHMQNPMAAHFQQQQLQAAMYYQQLQGGVTPGQPQFMYGPPGVDPQFVQSGGFVMPGGFVGAQSPVSGNVMMSNGSPYGGMNTHHNTYGNHHHGGRRYNNHSQSKRGSGGQ